jgi:hypothetical protein
MKDNKEEIIQDFLDEIFNEVRPSLKHFKGDDELISIMDISLFLKEDSSPDPRFKDNLKQELLKSLPRKRAENTQRVEMKFVLGFLSVLFVLFGVSAPFTKTGYLPKQNLSYNINTFPVYQSHNFGNLKNEPLLYNFYGSVIYFHYPNFFAFQ